ncbi:MAG: hypothetical protein IJ733_14590, partial [Lachnospiraceae bacterium]|nr:hypothetical protein [Lachnospiraceae bacterium]
MYYIRVSHYYHSSAEYTLQVIFEEEGDGFEEEPNDELSTLATDISVNTVYTGNQTHSQDIDYYRFSLPKKGKLWVNFSHKKMNDSTSFWKGYLMDDNEGFLAEFTSTGETAKILSDLVRVPKGDYYIRIESDYWSNEDYSFMVNYKPEGAGAETEVNDDYDCATEIPFRKELTGNIQSWEDVDFYKFRLNARSTVRLQFHHKKNDQETSFWTVELHDANSSEPLISTEERTSTYISGTDAEDIPIIWTNIPKGLYYIKVYRDYYSNADYRLFLDR